MKMKQRSFGVLAVVLLAVATLTSGQAFAQANLTITKTDNETVATAGLTTLTYEIVVSNTGDAPIIDVTVVDTFPDSLSCGYSAASTGTNAASGFTSGPIAADADIADSDINMPADSQVTYTATCDVLSSAPAGLLTNTAVVASDGLQVEFDATDDDTLVARVSDLSLIKGDNDIDVVAGTLLTYQFAVNNAGPSAADAVTVVDTLPTGTVYVSDTATPGCVEAPAGTVTCVLGDAPAGADGFFDMVVAVQPSVTDPFITNVAVVSSDSNDPDEANNIDEETTNVDTLADLSIDKTSSPDDLVALGQQLTYSFEVDNDGPSDAQNVQTIDDLPLVFAGQVASMPNECSEVLGVITCDWGTLPAGFNTSYDIVINVPEQADALGGQLNEVEIVTTTTDPDPANDDSAASVDVVVAVPSEDTAVISVQKYFLDGNDETSVTLTLQCASGSYAPDTVTVNPDTLINAPIGTMVEHTFVITNIPDGAPNPCTVVEQTVDGYDAVYVCPPDGSTSVVDDDLCVTEGDIDPIDLPDSEACGWLDVTSGDSNLCVVLNIPAPVDVDVTKVWEEFGGTQADFDPDVRITLTCPDALGIIGGTQINGSWVAFEFLNEEDGDFDDEDDNYIGEGTAEFEVIPAWYPTAADPDDQEFTECFATENVSNDAVEVDNDCTDIEVAVGMGDECTITNTVFFEGIPTLNQYGMALLALLMLGMGFIGMRRLV